MGAAGPSESLGLWERLAWGPGVAKGWRSGSKAEREKERMSMSQPRTEPESERENEGNVCEGPGHSQETGRKRRTESEKWEECRGVGDRRRTSGGKRDEEMW